MAKRKGIIRHMLSIAACLLGVLIAYQSGPLPALAHEQRPVGKYLLVVGFLNEPAIQGEMNGIDLTITNNETKQPVDGAEKTLKAEVTAEGKTQAITLQARFRMPGKYAGYFIPTKEGQYRFHFTGTIEGQPVNETFESGPGRFEDVGAATAMQFPEKVPTGMELNQQLAAANAAAANAQAAAATATLLGIAGIIFGLLGLGAGAWGIMSRRRTSAATRAEPGPSSGR